MRTLEDRFWSKVNKHGPIHPTLGACWLWTGATTDGYGQAFVGGRLQFAHRVAYEWEHGPIPRGLVSDHLCRNRACVRPLHIEIVTVRVNILRGQSPSALNATKSTCPAGHPYNEQNTRRDSSGRRYCRPCQAAAQRRYYIRQHP